MQIKADKLKSGDVFLSDNKEQVAIESPYHTIAMSCSKNNYKNQKIRE